MNLASAKLLIASKQVGEGYPTFLIAEVAQSHDGSLGFAHAYIDAAAEAGVDAIKFQTHIAEAESTVDEPWRVKFSRQDESRFDYWHRMAFTETQWCGLAEHAAECGLVFLSSPFSLEAVELLSRVGMPAWKVASGEVRSKFLLDAMIQTGKPLLVSTGMSSWREIDAIATDLVARQVPFALFQCTTRYPTGLEDVGLNVIQEFRRRYACPVGISDHTGNLNVLMAALARGANIIEAHITFDRRMFGPDTTSSLTVDEFRQLVVFRDTLAELDCHPVDKDRVAEELEGMRKLFMRSMALRNDLPAGTVLRAEHLTLKKPSTGIPEERMTEIVGKKLRRAVPASRLLNLDDLDND